MKKTGGTVKYRQAKAIQSYLMSSSGFDKDFWTRILDEHGLESPGYHEAVRDAKEISKKKAQEKLNPVENKKTKKKKK